MPIRPENKARYPKDWPSISVAAKDRAGWKCQHLGCTARQYSVGHWQRFPGEPWVWRPVEGNKPASTANDNAFDLAGQGCDTYGIHWKYKDALAFVRHWWAPADEDWPTIVVLTCAHLNHEPEDCRPENLAAMCQRHHPAYDADLHKRTAYATRKARAMTAELF